MTNWDDAPSPSDLAQEAFEQCESGGPGFGHVFPRSPSTGEWLRCTRCGADPEALDEAKADAAWAAAHDLSLEE